jgi:hypothetical protein
MSVLLLAHDGTGLHGTNGLPPTTCIKLFNTYVFPRLSLHFISDNAT